MRMPDKKGLWFNSFFRQIAYALIGGLSAVFIFMVGSESFGPKGVVGGVMMLLWFIVVLRLIVVLFVIWISNFVIRKIGYKKSVLLSVILNIFSFYCLSLAERTGNPIWILVSAFVLGLAICTYWIPFESLIPENTSEKKMGSAFGALEVVSQIGQVIAPIIGALVAINFGFDALFVWGMVFLAFSSVPMFFLRKHEHKDSVSWGEFWKWSREKTFMKLGVASAGRMISDVVYVDLWPVYVFLLIGSIESIGWLKSVVILATAFFTWIVSKRFDRAKNNLLQIVGVGGGLIFWTLRLMVRTLPMVILVDTLDRYFATASRVFFFGKLFRRAKGNETFSFIVYWELWQSAGVMLVALILILWLYLFGMFGFWPMAFGMAALGSVLSLLVEEHQR